MRAAVAHHLAWQLRLRRERLGKRKRRPIRPPRWLHPDGAARKYKALLLELVRSMRDLFQKRVVPELPQLARQASAELPTRRDDANDPRSLYAYRPLLNATDVAAWSRRNGLTPVEPGEMHVTLAHSRESLLWPPPGLQEIQVDGGSRTVMRLGDEGAAVLLFESSDLQQEWADLRSSGAEWSQMEYRPHVTFSYDPAPIVDLAGVKPYQGALVFGPAVFQEISGARSDALSPGQKRKSTSGPSDWGPRVVELTAGVLVSLEPDIEQASEAADAIGLEVASWNRTQFRSVMKGALAVEVFANEPWLTGQLKSFGASQATFIQSLVEKPLAEISEIIQKGFRAGLQYEDLVNQISDRFDVAESRAEQIGADQVSKLNGEITKLRQQEVGVSSYVWRTQMDDRVRETHAENEGQVFQWDDPPEETGHPGEDWGCRCWPDANLEELVAQVDDATGGDLVDAEAGVA